MEPFNSDGRQMLESLGYIEDQNYITCTVDNLVDKIKELEKTKNMLLRLLIMVKN